MPADLMDRRLVLAGGLAASLPVGAQAKGAEAQTLILKTAKGRVVKSLLWRPAKPRGLVLFSHGFNSGPDKYPDILNQWVKAGFVVAAPVHIDSPQYPEHITQGGADSANGRIEDMALLADALSPGFDGYVIAGHSAGGLTADLMVGARPIPPIPPQDKRIKAAITFSPPGVLPNFIAADGYASIDTPQFLQTGDLDVPALPGAVWRDHLTPYVQAPANGTNYALVLEGADHFFGGLICWSRPGPPQPKQLKDAARLSTLFLQAYGAEDKAAHKALDLALSDNGPVMLTRR